MKSAFWLAAVALCLSATLDAQHASGIPVVNADCPTIIAFFPNASKTGPDDPDGMEALSDFEYCAGRVKKPLSQRGIQFTEERDRSFRIRSGGEIVLFTPKTDTPGYYFVQRSKKPRIEYGVMADVDLLTLAKEYFDSPHSAGTSIPEPFGSVLPKVKTKSRIAVLLPSELSEPFSKAKYAVVGKASVGEYAISLYYEPGIGDAGFAALFAAKANPGFEPKELANVSEVKLAHGVVGYFRPVSCGGSCAPANLWWKEGRVLYQVQLRLSSTLSEGDQRRAMIATADSAILAGPR